LGITYLTPVLFLFFDLPTRGDLSFARGLDL